MQLAPSFGVGTFRCQFYENWKLSKAADYDDCPDCAGFGSGKRRRTGVPDARNFRNRQRRPTGGSQPACTAIVLRRFGSFASFASESWRQRHHQLRPEFGKQLRTERGPDYLSATAGSFRLGRQRDVEPAFATGADRVNRQHSSAG